MKHPKLKAEERIVLGKKVKKLRREGFLPANVYGKEMKSTAVQVLLTDFQTMYKEVGETGLIDLEVNGTAKPVLVKNLQMDYQAMLPLHADFYQVDLKAKVKTMVPLVIIGEAKAVTDKVGLLLNPVTEVEVEALPEDLPENITVDVSHLAQIDEQITVADLKIPTGVTVLSDPAQVIAKIDELVTKEAQEEAAAEAAAAEAAKAEETAEGETPTEGTEAKEEVPVQEEKKEAPAEEKK